MKHGTYYRGECSQHDCHWHGRELKDGNGAVAAADQHYQSHESGHRTRVMQRTYVMGRLLTTEAV